MSRPFRLARAALAALGGLLLAGLLATPAAAAPASFEVHDVGEDLCTFYDTKGEAEWFGLEDPVASQVRITGIGAVSHAPPDTICLSVVPAERQIEFIAYVREEPVDAHVEPFDRLSPGPWPGTEFPYEFSLTGPEYTPIDYVTVAICKVEYTGFGDRCTEPVVVGPVTE